MKRVKKNLKKFAAEKGKTAVTAAFTVSDAQPPGDIVAIMNSWIREAHPDAKVNAGYMTLVNVGSKDVRLTKVESEAFEKIEVHEMAMVDGLMTMRELTQSRHPSKQSNPLPTWRHAPHVNRPQVPPDHRSICRHYLNL